MDPSAQYIITTLSVTDGAHPEPAEVLVTYGPGTKRPGQAVLGHLLPEGSYADVKQVGYQAESLRPTLYGIGYGEPDAGRALDLSNVLQWLYGEVGEVRSCPIAAVPLVTYRAVEPS